MAPPRSRAAIPPLACCGRYRTRAPGPSSGSSQRSACTTTKRGSSAGSARPARTRSTMTLRPPHCGRRSPGIPAPRQGGGPARPDRHRGHRQRLRRRDPVPRPDPPLPPVGRPRPGRRAPPARRDPGHPPRRGRQRRRQLRRLRQPRPAAAPGYLCQAHVFRRQGLPCQVCGTPIIRSTVAGRATNFCPHCQQR